MITFKLTEEDVRVISEALSNMPFGKVVNLIGKLQTQLQVQTKKPKVPKGVPPRKE